MDGTSTDELTTPNPYNVRLQGPGPTGPRSYRVQPLQGPGPTGYRQGTGSYYNTLSGLSPSLGAFGEVVGGG